MGDINANGVQNQADVNAQLQALQAGQAQLTETMNAMSAQLNRLGQGNHPNAQPAARRFGPYLERPQSQSEGDDSDYEPPDRGDEGRAARDGRREYRIQGDGSPIRRRNGSPNRRRDRSPNQRRGRDRDEEDDRRGGKALKLIPPTFAGKVDPDAYITWEKRMEYIFDYYNYSEAKKIALAAAQLTDNALSWWDRDVAKTGPTWRAQTFAEMRTKLRGRYIPSYYQRDLLKRFLKLSQGTKSVEEYFEEFESLRNKLDVDEPEASLMAQFLEGLHYRIACKVERQLYEDFNDLLHFAVQAEAHIKRKSATTSRSKPAWSQSASKGTDKNKSIEVENRFKKNQAQPSKTGQTDHGKTQAQNQRARDITCYKCQGKGHYARD